MIAMIGEVKRKTEFCGVGCLVQGIGLVSLFFFPYGTIIGILLLLIGSQMSMSWICSVCRGKIDKKAKICPHCQSELQ